MRSEAEIRKAVETRLRRWGLLALNGILWVGALKLIFGYSQFNDFQGTLADVVAGMMVIWLALFGLHALRTFYVELREYLVRRAIEREHRLHTDYEKPKRLELGEDGELVEYLDHEDEHAQRSRNS